MSTFQNVPSSRSCWRPLATEAHWRSTFATLALIVWYSVALYLFVLGLAWLSALLPVQPWSFTPVSA